MTGPKKKKKQRTTPSVDVNEVDTVPITTPTFTDMDEYDEDDDDDVMPTSYEGMTLPEGLYVSTYDPASKSLVPTMLPPGVYHYHPHLIHHPGRLALK